jgi:hypothetical protein
MILYVVTSVLWSEQIEFSIYAYSNTSSVVYDSSELGGETPQQVQSVSISSFRYLELNIGCMF